MSWREGECWREVWCGREPEGTWSSVSKLPSVCKLSPSVLPKLPPESMQGVQGVQGCRGHKTQETRRPNYRYSRTKKSQIIGTQALENLQGEHSA